MIVNDLLEKANMSRYRLSKESGVAMTTITDICSGKADLDRVLLVDNNGAVKVGAPTVEGAKVVAEVVNPLVKGEKVVVFKMKRRKDYRVKNGHRTHFTEVEVKSINA